MTRKTLEMALHALRKRQAYFDSVNADAKRFQQKVDWTPGELQDMQALPAAIEEVLAEINKEIEGE